MNLQEHIYIVRKLLKVNASTDIINNNKKQHSKLMLSLCKYLESTYIYRKTTNLSVALLIVNSCLKWPQRNLSISTPRASPKVITIAIET